MTLASSCPRLAAGALALALTLAACGRGGEKNIWDLKFTASPDSIARGEITGYWEGDVAMGGIRVRIENDRITLALRCDSAGKTVAQATAPMTLVSETPGRMVLQENLAGGDEECGFRFNKGNAFVYRLSNQGTMEIAFAGASVSRLRKIADLPSVR